MHESEWRDWVRQYLGGLETQIAAITKFGGEGRWVRREAARDRGEVRVGRRWDAEAISRSAWYRSGKSGGSP